MILNGTRPAKHLHREKQFRFGDVNPSTLADFCVDPGLTMPAQNADSRPFECVGYTAADWLADTFGVPFSPDFSYAAARYIAGDGPEGTPGTSFHAGMQGVFALGGLALADADPILVGSAYTEKLVSDWNSWTPAQRKLALKRIQNGTRNVLGQHDPFDAIILAAYQTGKGISVGSPWFYELGQNNGGFVPSLTKSQDGDPSWHNYAIKGQESSAVWGIRKRYAMVKSWQGKDVGNGGWVYFDEDTVNYLMSIEGAGAITIDPSCIRWIAILGVLAMRFPYILPQLPALIKAGLQTLPQA